MSLTGLGIALGTLGSIAINTGNNLQSLGMTQLESRIHAEEVVDPEDGSTRENDEEKNNLDADSEIDACQSKTWIVGTVIFISGSLLNFAAFAFAPQSILASLEGIQFVTNVLFGKLVLGKEITRCMWLGTGVTVFGVALTVLSASVVGTLEAGFKDLQALWGEPAWIVYLGLTVFIGIALQTTHQIYLKAKAKGTPLPFSEYVLPVTYATFSALFGTLSVVQAKILSEILTLQFEGTPIFWGRHAWFTYVTLLAWLLLVAVWLFRMNEALSLYDPLFIIPLLQMNFILFAIISGGIYFKEFDEFGTLNWLGFILGVSMLFLGIYLLSPNAAVQSDEEAEEGAQGEPPSSSTEVSAVASLVGFGSSARIAPAEDDHGGESGGFSEPDVPSTPRTRSRQGTPASSGDRGGLPSSLDSPRDQSRSQSRPRRPSSGGDSSEQLDGVRHRLSLTTTSSTTGTPITSTLPFYNLIPPSMRTQMRDTSSEDPNGQHQEALLVDALRQVAQGVVHQVAAVSAFQMTSTPRDHTPSREKTPRQQGPSAPRSKESTLADGVTTQQPAPPGRDDLPKPEEGNSDEDGENLMVDSISSHGSSSSDQPSPAATAP